MTELRRSRIWLSLPALALVAACADQEPIQPITSSAPSLSSGSSSVLVECDATTSVSATDTISVLGGTIQVTDAAGGTHAVTFPENAVATATVFEFSVPASKYVEVDVTAKDLLSGEPIEIAFPADAQPTLAISYRRCTRADICNKDLGIFNIDGATKAILEGPFGGKEGNVSDPRVVGQVPHFSAYAVGTPQ